MLLMRTTYPAFRPGTPRPIYWPMVFKRLGLVLLAALAGCGGGEPPVSQQVRDAGLRFAPEVSAGDREWILAAIEQARPEARSLVDDIDGMVVVKTYSDPNSPAVGLMVPTGPGAYDVSFNLAYLNANRRQDRDSTVLHELAHVIDHALVAPELRDRLAAQLPSVGTCVTAHTGDCTEPAERFADTFAKWALRGAVSAYGAGYGVATPVSLEDWGAPLAALAIDIEVAAGR
jgi:hypothetical protein